MGGCSISQVRSATRPLLTRPLRGRSSPFGVLTLGASRALESAKEHERTGFSPRQGARGAGSGGGGPGLGARSGTPIRESSCCDHPLTGARWLRSWATAGCGAEAVTQLVEELAFWSLAVGLLGQLAVPKDFGGPAPLPRTVVPHPNIVAHMQLPTPLSTRPLLPHPHSCPPTHRCTHRCTPAHAVAPAHTVAFVRGLWRSSGPKQPQNSSHTFALPFLPRAVRYRWSAGCFLSSKPRC